MGSLAIRETGNVNDSNHSNFSRSSLLSLPRELRDMIFAPLLRSGDIAILRTSKQVCDEGVERLYREGVFRLTVGFQRPYEYDVVEDPSALNSQFFARLKNFQNFHFHIDWRPVTLQYPGVDLWRMDEFSRLDVAYPKRECLITIEYGACCVWALSCPHEKVKGTLPDKIACLIAFEAVVVMFFPKPPMMWENGRELDKEIPKYFNRAMGDRWIKLKEKLEPTLGPAKLVVGKNTEPCRMICHPQAFQRSIAQRQQGNRS